MSFTDEDLKRAKKLLRSEMSMQKIVLNNPEIESLLARLEAAEDLIGVTIRHSEYETRIEAWRKACGEVGK